MAKTVPVNKLIEEFQTMYREHWPYVWGKAEKGCVDCSGAFVYAFGKYGISYPHGSNAIARNYIYGKMLPISEAKPGMAAFKVKTPGEKGYDLPDKYKNSGNLNDFYHIGLVDEDRHYVLDAKGTDYGFCRDELTAKNGWDCVAYLLNVDYGEGGNPMSGEMAKVVLPEGAKGDTVNMRSSASKSADIVAKVPVGSAVEILLDQGQWCEIVYNGRDGWMMSNYLEYTGQGGEEGALSSDQRQEIDKALKEIERLNSMILSQVDIIGMIVGRG